MENTIQYRGYTIAITEDLDPLNPLRDFNTLGTFSCFHRRYNLSSENSDFADREELQKYINSKDVISLPLYLLDHSGQSMRTTPFQNTWDSGQVGYIHVTKDKVREEYGWQVITAARLSKVYDTLRSEVKTYDQYLTGEIYGYEITSEEGEYIDRCSGYFGDDHEASGLLESARNAIDCINSPNNIFHS